MRKCESDEGSGDLRKDMPNTRKKDMPNEGSSDMRKDMPNTKGKSGPMKEVVI